MKNFNINDQWQFYLKQMKLDIGVMPLDQVRECFRAFLGGISQLYIYINSDLHELSEHQALEAFQDLEKQITEFIGHEAEFERLEKIAEAITNAETPEEIIKHLNVYKNQS